MRAGPKPLPAALILPVVLMAIAPAAARPESRPHPGRHHPPAGSDMDLTLSRMAARAQRDWQIWQAPRPLALALPPATRERVAAPPFTGWGYGGTVPGAWPGF